MLATVASYEAFGFRLECDFELPELVAVPRSSEAAWHIATRHTVAPPGNYTAIGSDIVYGDVHVQAFASATSFRLMFDDTGTFDVVASEKRITWYPGTGATGAAVRADLLGRVIAMAAHSAGALALHASAVSIEGEAIALLGPKHAGKSTLALALVKAGARLLTDDTLVVRVEAGGAAWASPGVQRVRLWEDSARALDVRTGGDAGAKPTIDVLPPDRLETADVRLGACYVLQRAGSPADSVRRSPMSAVHAALSCVRFSKLGPLVGGREGVVVLERAGELTASVPIFAADVRRDLTTLDRVAAELLAWHSRARAPNAMVGR
jgi:hypothetical protein